MADEAVHDVTRPGSGAAMRHTPAPDTLAARLHFRMAFIRGFEERLLSLYDQGRLYGTTHTYIGQEATATAVLHHLAADDAVCSQHRSHGYYLAAGGDPRKLFLEILGDRDGLCNGMGGSQHLYSPNFLSNGIIGGTPGIATGLGLAAKLRGKGVIVSFIGDGTLGEGLLYESFNLAQLWRLPVLFVLENNRYAQTTPVERAVAGRLIDRPKAFGMAADEIESNDVIELLDRFGTAFAHVRGGKGPFCQIVHTYRLGPHSKSDDHRSPTEIAAWQSRDPLRLSAARLGKSADDIERRAMQELDEAMRMPEAARSPDPADLGDDRDLIPGDRPPTDGWRRGGEGAWLVAYLQSVFHDILRSRAEVVLLGEDVLDPYGGAFKVYKGLSSAFPERVVSTPISEAGITAAANGLALRGFRPVVELMFGDFLTLAMDQLVNHAAKFGRMFRRKDGCPVIVRLPSGGYRGYGPTHSQSLEKLVLGVPGLIVTATDLVHDPRLLWQRMLDLPAPCVHVENKTLYARELPDVSQGRLGPFTLVPGRGYFPTTRATLDPRRLRVDAAIVAYGGLVDLATEAALSLFEDEELFVDIVIPSQLAPIPLADIAAHIAPADAVVVLEEGTERAGFGAEVIASLTCCSALDGRPAARCAALDTLLPANADLERHVLPGVDRLVDTVRKVCRR